MPGSRLVRPSYMCRSDPQILVVVIFTSTSVGCSILASGTSLTTTSRGPSYTSAFILGSPQPFGGLRLRSLCRGGSPAIGPTSRISMLQFALPAQVAALVVVAGCRPGSLGEQGGELHQH